jgi:hypothetical protein
MRIDEFTALQNREFSLRLTEAKMDCPPATEDLEINTQNRNDAIQAEHVQYGPLNVDEPGNFWRRTRQLLGRYCRLLEHHSKGSKKFSLRKLCGI